jgi:hypothetical protein
VGAAPQCPHGEIEPKWGRHLDLKLAYYHGLLPIAVFDDVALDGESQVRDVRREKDELSAVDTSRS